MANLAMQRLVLLSGETGATFAAAIGAGTVVGLVVKYLLDKAWIFNDREVGIKAHSRKFTLYAIMGIVTTCIFWGTETTFWLVWNDDQMREVGAILGLSVGYIIKYNLDRRFVFSGASLRPSLAP